MQNIIKKRLHQQNPTVSQSVLNSTSASSSSATSSSSTTNASLPTSASSASSNGQSQQRPTQPQQQPRQPLRNQAEPDPFETRSYMYDIVIAVIVGIIALLLYRRFSIAIDVPPPEAVPPE